MTILQFADKHFVGLAVLIVLSVFGLCICTENVFRRCDGCKGGRKTP